MQHSFETIIIICPEIIKINSHYVGNSKKPKMLKQCPFNQ